MIKRRFRLRTSLRYGGALFLASLFLVSCATVDERYVAREQYDHRDQRRHIEPAFTIERTGTAVTITTPWLPGTEIQGFVEDLEVKDANVEAPIVEETTVYVTGVHLFTNWANGWTEGYYEASGTLHMVPAGPGYDSEDNAQFVLEVDEPIELWTLTAGGIRYYDTYILGDDGLIRVRERASRLREVAQWMREQGGPDMYGSDSRDGIYGPAMVDDVLGAVERSVGNATAPEWLVTLYQSQSLERDLREASGMLVAFYNLEHVNGSVLDSRNLEMR